MDVARPPHLEALIGAKPRILDMIQGAATAGLRSEQPLLARLDTLIEAATAAFLDALDDSEKTHSQAALAKKHSKQLTTHGSEQYKNPTVPEIEHSGLASQHGDDHFKPTFAPLRKSRLTASQLQASLSRLSDRYRLRRLTHSAHQKSVAASDKD